MKSVHPRCGPWMTALAFCLVAVQGQGAETTSPSETIPKLSGPMFMDGALHESQWRNALRITYHRFKLWQPQSDKLTNDEFVLRMFHDGNFLYIAVASYDRYVESAADTVNSDGLYALSLLGKDHTIHHYRLRWTTPEAQAAGEMLDIEWSARLRGPFNDTSREGGGYVLEFAVPLKTLTWEPGESVKINVLIQDHDNNPGGAYNAPTTRFARFALGHFDSDDPSGFYAVQLAP